MVIKFTDVERSFVESIVNMLSTLDIPHVANWSSSEIDLQILLLPSAEARSNGSERFQ